jgi:hypothetical protein
MFLVSPVRAINPEWLFEISWMKNTSYEASYYEIFSSLLMHTCRVWYAYVNFFPKHCSRSLRGSGAVVGVVLFVLDV